MYTVIYLYQVNNDNIMDFLETNDKLKEIFLDNGALEDEIYLAEDLQGKDGCRGILDLVERTPDEQVFLGQSVFRNQSHYEEVLERVQEHEENEQLMSKLTRSVDVSKTFMGTFVTPD
jgi:hypothetical protein